MTPLMHALDSGEPARMPSSPAVTELERSVAAAGAMGAAETVDAFLSSNSFPLAEPPYYTLVYRGPGDDIAGRFQEDSAVLFVHGLENLRYKRF